MTPERWKQIEEIYHGAQGLSPSERAAFLDQACRGDESMRRHVQNLLNEPVSGGFLDEPAAVRGAHLIADLTAEARVGSSIGTYQIEELLGVGGMGEVYRARDSRLGRSVAIKVLPTAFSTEPDRVARLEREARILATLNHPNICAIYEIEEIDGIKLLVLELVEGQTLAERLAAQSAAGRAGLPLPEALAIARQIADAFEVAHDKGIAHRDLKPANVRITADGVVKVLDFGLAKSVVGDGTADLTIAPQTFGSGLRAGIVMGTAAYMSPEQARGLPVDRRTDIWAFGCVLYEMLTGRVAFAGDTISDSIAKVLEREPDWTALPDATPVAIRRLLARSLVKDSKKRLKDIGDVRLEIDAIDERVPGVDGATSRATSALSRRAWLPWTAAALATLVLAGVLVWQFRPAPSAPVAVFPLVLPQNLSLNGSRGAHIVAVSPDGEAFAFSGAPKGVYLRSLSDPEWRIVPGTEEYEVVEPVFSPDGRSIAFFSFDDRTIKTIAVTGGAAETVCQTRPVFGMRWESDSLIFGQGNDGVKRVPARARSGTPETLIKVNADEFAHQPQTLPDGEHVLFTVARGTSQYRWDQAQVFVESLTTHIRTKVLDGGSDARYLPSGHLVFAFSGSLYAQPFDLRRRQPFGERRPVIPGIRRASGNFTGAAAFNISDTGTLIYVPGPVGGSASAPSDLALMDRQGNVEPLLNGMRPGPHELARVSPDGLRVAFGSDDGKDQVIYTYDLRGKANMQPLVFDGRNRYPVWISNRELAFQSDHDGSRRIWLQALDGGPAEPLPKPEPGTEQAPESWHEDTKTLLYSVTNGTAVTLWTYSRNDGRNAKLDTPVSFATTGATFSPDGHWLVYAITSPQGRMTLFVQQFPSGRQIKFDAELSDTPKHARWSPDGKELCIDPNVAPYLQCMRFLPNEPLPFGSPVRVDRKLRASPPQTRTNYDIVWDGPFAGRFVGFVTAGMKQYVGESSKDIRIELNWFEKLKPLK